MQPSETETTQPDRLDIAQLMREYAPGSGDWSWNHEAKLLWADDTEKMADLTRSVTESGVLTPILLGDDYRVWDGHHRILAARAALLTRVPVEYGHGGAEGRDGVPKRCTKKRFATESLALTALRQNQNRPNPTRTEQRAYDCRPCRAWHLTSMPLLTPVVSRG